MSTENKHAYKQGFWKEHSSAWKSSGLTQVAYCAQEDISYQSFVYQHNRIASKFKKTTLSFVEARPEPVPAGVQPTGLQLMLPNGIRIGISSEVSAVLLKTVLSIAGAMPC